MNPYTTGRTRAARDRARDNARRYRARQAALARLMLRHGWRAQGGMFVPVTR